MNTRSELLCAWSGAVFLLVFTAGFVLMVLSWALIIPFAAGISMQINRMHGGPSVLSYTQLACASSNVVLVIIPELLWTTAAFRPEQNPELIRMLNDMGWITFLWPVGTFVVQVVAVGLATLSDHLHVD